MSRREFSRKTKRQAWDRSGGRCEAVGAIYGLPAGLRCIADLMRTGVNYDHVDPDANSKDNSLDNCAAVCPPCHKWKSGKRDVPMIAKTVRQQDAARGIKRTKRPFPKRANPWGKPRDTLG